jgi:spore coat protein CotF
MITNITLTTKEKFLLEDAKTHEQQCILKYDNYANLACDNQLKAVFRSNGQKEEEHLQTINQLLSGKVPNMSQNGGQSGSQGGKQSGQQGGSGQQTEQMPQSQQASIDQSSSGCASFKASDKDLCTDVLMMEKYVSGAYDTAIFEFKDAQVRDVLNHIQKEEQKHGEAVFSYMQSKGMYSTQ